MKTTTSAWTAALAVMSMRGPVTMAEAAPAKPQEEPERPKYYFPRQAKRNVPYGTGASPSPSSASPSIQGQPSTSPVFTSSPTASSPPITAPSSQPPSSSAESLGGYSSAPSNTVPTSTTVDESSGSVPPSGYESNTYTYTHVSLIVNK